MTNFVGLSEHEALAVASMFDVDEAAVFTDHLVALIVAELARDGRSDLALGAGTALGRVHLPAAQLMPLSRLSADVELVTTADPGAVAHRLGHVVVRALRPGHGRPTWSPHPAAMRAGPAVLHTEAGLSVRLFLTGVGVPGWPTERLDVEPRYGDVGRVPLRVLTVEACAAWTCLRWCTRAAPEDLYDLWTLARAGAVTPAAARLCAEHRPADAPPPAVMFATPPSDEQWRAALVGQTRPAVSASQALDEVARAWARAEEKKNDGERFGPAHVG